MAGMKEKNRLLRYIRINMIMILLQWLERTQCVFIRLREGKGESWYFKGQA